MMRLRNILICLTAALGSGLFDAGAQHTLTAVAGTGISTARFYPDEETRTLGGAHEIVAMLRFYSPTPRIVVAIGAELEYIRCGFSLGYTYTTEIVDDKEIRNYEYYTRRINTLMLPLVWQPHFYMARNHLRFYIEAAVFFSYNMSSTYVYDDNPSKGGGDYPYKSVRDNRLGYGLAGGAGFSLLFGQVEFGLRARYWFGYSDLLKNRNKYYDSATDGQENPFYYSPLRSPLDNITLSITLGWRFNKGGFDSWNVKREKRSRSREVFKYSLD